MVKCVPPPVPPRNGVQPVTVEVNEVLYVNVAESLTPFSLTTTSQGVSAFSELGGILKLNFLFYITPNPQILISRLQLTSQVIDVASDDFILHGLLHIVTVDNEENPTPPITKSNPPPKLPVIVCKTL
jgi:hypothetical protein